MAAFIFGGDTAETPESIKRKRDVVRALMAAQGAPRNVGEGLNALGDGIVANVLDRRADKAEKAGLESASADFAPLASMFGGGSSSAAPSAIPSPGAAAEMGASPDTDVGGLEAYIRESATKRGIDPEVAVKVARSEGLAPGVWQSNVINKAGKRETSYGPFQLLVGGGLGDKFQKVYGKSPSDPSTARDQIDFALDEAATGGWSPWYGAAKVGVGARTGLEKARALGYQPKQVASIDPSIGMPDAAGQLSATSPQPAPVPQTAPVPTPAQPAAAPAPQQQTAQALVAPQQQPAPVDTRAIMKALSNPFLPQGQRAVAEALLQQENQRRQAILEQQLKQQDPAYQLDLQKGKIELENLKSPKISPADQSRIDLEKEKFSFEKGKPTEVGGRLIGPDGKVVYEAPGKWQKLDDGSLFNESTGEFRMAPKPEGQENAFRFKGTSVEAQALNGLMDTGALTSEQAQQLGAGKTITGPNGEIIFMTPQGVFANDGKSNTAKPYAPTQQPPQQPYVDLFGSEQSSTPPAAPAASPSAPSASVPAPAPATTATPAVTPEQRPGMIPLTAPKPGKPLTENERKNQSLYSVIKPELKIVEDNFDALSDLGNQAYSKLPFSEYATTPEYQKAANSLQTIVSSYLYSVSGATATPDEVRKQTDILTPRPGESAESIANKKRRVRTMVEAVAATGGITPDQPPPAATDNSKQVDELLKKYGVQ